MAAPAQDDGATDVYLVFKLLHIGAVIVFLGNIATGLFWHAWAARTRDPKLLAHAMGGIIRSDRLFTVPGVMVIIVTGITAAIEVNLPILRTGWILWTLVLFSISGLAFSFRVAPLQRQLHSLATNHAGGEFLYERYRSIAFRWEMWRGLALATPLAGLALMVLKPSL